MFWWSFKLIWSIAKFRLDKAGTACFFFFFFFYASLVCQACLRASQTQFSTSDSQAAVVSSSRKILVLCIWYEDKLILHSLDLICCVSNNFLALFGNNLLPHRPPLFSVQFPNNIHTAGDQNNTDKTWFQSTLTGLLLVAKNTGISVFIGIFRSVYRYSVKFNTDSVYAPISAHPSYFEVIDHKIIIYLPTSVH